MVKYRYVNTKKNFGTLPLTMKEKTRTITRGVTEMKPSLLFIYLLCPLFRNI